MQLPIQKISMTPLVRKKSIRYFDGQVLYGYRVRLAAIAERLRPISAAAVLVVAVSVFMPGRAISASVEPITVGTMTVTIGPVQGKEAVSIEGKAPAMAPVTLRLYGTYSRDLPDVFLNRRDILADASGHFSAVVPVAPDFWRGTVLTVTASSPDAATSATAKTNLVVPNQGIVGLPGDDLPNH
jgi:hypothetical protein